MELQASRAHTWGVVATDLLESDPLRIGGVQLVGRLGEGGMGVVYLGRASDGGAVAVKVIRTDLAADADFRRRFASEVSALRGLGGAHTAVVLSSDVDAAQPWMVMEYVHGATLAEAVNRSGPMEGEDFEVFADELLNAVAALWRAGIVHRDLKPSNVVLSPDGVKVLDFGVARFRGEPLDPARVGSTTWMAPEQLAGSHDDSACDVHACAMLLYFAATGRHVYGYGEADAVGWRIQNSTPHLVDLPEELSSLRPALTAALAKDPAQRPSIEALRQAVIGGAAVAPTSVYPASANPRTAVAGNHPSAPQVAAQSPGAARGTAPVAARSAAVSAAAPPAGAPPAPAPGVAGPTDAERLRVRSLGRRVRTLALVFLALWVVGWTVGMWPLGGPWAPGPTAQECFPGAQPADFATGAAFATSGAGEVSRSIWGPFPGPFGQFRAPTAAVGCQIGRAVEVKCPESNLIDGATLTCQATDATGGTATVTISRQGDTWLWSL